MPMNLEIIIPSDEPVRLLSAVAAELENLFETVPFALRRRRAAVRNGKQQWTTWKRITQRGKSMLSCRRTHKIHEIHDKTVARQAAAPDVALKL